jgi:hypothetical protein
LSLRSVFLGFRRVFGLLALLLDFQLGSCLHDIVSASCDCAKVLISMACSHIRDMQI